MSVPFEVSLSAIDEARFGVRTAKAMLGLAADVPTLLDFCRANGAELAIVRCPTLDLSIAQALECAGFFLTGTLLHLKRDLTRKPIPPKTDAVKVRPVKPGEEVVIGRLAADAFRGYRGHYHADPNLDPAKCDEVYVDWAIRSCTTPGVADEVLVAEDNGEIVGFTTLQMVSADTATSWLSGIKHAARGQHAYRSLKIQSMLWLQERGGRWNISPTLLSNIAVQKALARLGYEPSHSYYTFHKWFRMAG